MRFLLLLFFPLITLAQKNFTGFIVDKTTGNKIPYATVGLIKENKGACADKEGTFSIYTFLQNDSLRISSVGYETLMLPVKGWVNGNIVELQQKRSVLKEIVISNKPKQVYTLNRFGHCSSNWYWTGLGAIYQKAQLFEAQNEGMQLTDLEICKDASESIFRIRIYDVDTISGSPSNDLTDTVIEIRSKESHVQMNLEKYDIVIEGKSFFVAIEWLFIPFNEQLEKEKINGRKIYKTWYKPSLRYVKNRNAKAGNVWELGFNGKWKTWPFDQDKNFQITPKLK